MAPKNPTLDFICQNSTLSLEEVEYENDCLFKNNSRGLRFEAGTIETDEIIVCCAINFIIETLGNGLLILMIINEKYLMDPQKRTAINQIATHMNYQYILNNIIGAPLLTLTIIYNDIGNISLGIHRLDRLINSRSCRTRTCAINFVPNDLDGSSFLFHSNAIHHSESPLHQMLESNVVHKPGLFDDDLHSNQLRHCGISCDCEVFY